MPEPIAGPAKALIATGASDFISFPKLMALYYPKIVISSMPLL